MLVYSSQVSELIVFAQHSICDGTALAILVRDILVYYNDPAKDVHVLHPPVNTDYLPKVKFSISGLVKNVFINHRNSQWRKKPHYFTQEDFNEIHIAYWEKSRHNIVLLQLEPEETSDLISRCREKGVTVVSVVTAAFLAARQDVIGPFSKKGRLTWIPYDLRRHLREDVGDVFCLFAGLTAFSFSYDQKKNLWENAQELHTIIRKGVDRLDLSGSELYLLDPTLVDACCNFACYAQQIPEAFEKRKKLSVFAQDKKNIAFTLFRKAESTIPSITNTNLGRLDFPETYGNLRLVQMFFMPPANRGTSLTLGGAGVSGKLVFSLNYVEDIKKEGSSLTENMIGIRNRTLEYLGFPEKANDRAM